MAIRVTGLNSGMDTDAMVKELVSAYDTKTKQLEKQKTKMEWTQEAWKSINTKIYSFYTNKLSNLRFSSAYVKKSASVSDNNKAKVSASSEAVAGTQTLKIKELAQTAYLTGSEIKTKDDGEVNLKTTMADLGLEDFSIKVNLKGKDSVVVDFAADSKVSDVIAKLKDAGVNASFDEKNQRFFISGKESGEDNNFTLDIVKREAVKVTDPETGEEKEEMQEVAMTDEQKASLSRTVKDALGIRTKAEGGEASMIQGIDAEIELNGATFKSNTNNFTINGLNITAQSKTADGETLTITTNVDSQGIYDTIKDFIKEYNKLVNEIDKLFNADQAKNMDPLTSEEKDAMSDDEVEKWETKIKDSLLRRDATLSSVGSALKNAMNANFTIGGKTYNLASFGISTGSYFTSADNEKNAFHISGDKDDTTTSSNADKLLAAINSNPDAVAEFFSKLSKGVYDALDKKMKSTSMSSAYTVYNDKQIAKDLTAQESKIKSWKDKVADIEDRYYKQFAAMEKAMASLQSQQTSLAQLLGQ